MSPEVTTLYNPLALDIPEVQAEILVWTNNPVFVSQLAFQMKQGYAALIVGTTDPLALEALAVVFLPTNFDDYPWVVHFHSRGGRALTKVMVDAVLDFVRQAGYTGYKALNQSGLPDKVWLRIFQSGGKPEHLGSAYFFDLSEANNGRSSKRPVRRQKRDAKKLKQPASARAKLVKPARAAKRAKRRD